MSLGGRITRQIIDCILNGASWTTISNIYISLHTADPGEDGQGAGEVSGGSYARQQTGPSDWDAASGADPSEASNSSLITFPTATTNWGTITHFGFWTTLAGTGEADFVGATPCDVSRAIDSGETAEFQVGDITLSVD